MGFSEKVMEAGKSMNAIFLIGFIGIVWLIIWGNLSGNLGFASGTTNYNNTEGVIANLTEGTLTFYGFAPTWFVILAIVLLIVILIGLLGIVMKLAGGKAKDSGYAGM